MMNATQFAQLLNNLQGNQQGNLEEGVVDQIFDEPAENDRDQRARNRQIRELVTHLNDRNQNLQREIANLRVQVPVQDNDQNDDNDHNRDQGLLIKFFHGRPDENFSQWMSRYEWIAAAKGWNDE